MRVSKFKSSGCRKLPIDADIEMFVGQIVSVTKVELVHFKRSAFEAQEPTMMYPSQWPRSYVLTL
jgi:pyrimidine operon attenuation protein/uracil phosphoribosyltransferase